MNENYNTPNSGCCGRPMHYDATPKCNYNSCCMNEYAYKQKACIRNKQPDCEAQAVIPSITVETVDGITNLANCLVHVTSTNTTYYVDDKHRIMITWAGPVDIPGYDMENNPEHYKNQIVMDSDAEVAVIYNDHGRGFVFGITSGSVQEAISEKVEEMVEDGTFSEIVAEYLTDAPHTFDDVAALASAEGLVDGSYAVTYGYKRLGDGVYNHYKIREPGISEVADGYNKVSLPNSDNLIAEREQTGEERVIRLSQGDNIQDYLSLEDKKTIVLPPNTTYQIGQRIFINSDTTLDLNGSILLCDYVDDGETLFFTYGLNDTSMGYNGYKNIVVKNGTIERGCLCMMHNADVTIDSVDFRNTNSRHSMQIAGSYNVTVRNCVFNGTVPVNTHGSECINIDPCNYGGQPYMSQSSVMYDHTPNKRIYIENNTFSAPTEAGYRYTNAVGSHGRDDNNQTICDGLVISENDFGAPYVSAINMCDYCNVVVKDNWMNIDVANVDTVSYFIKMRGSQEVVKVHDNYSSNSSYFIYTGTDSYSNVVEVTSNRIYTMDTLTEPAFSLFYMLNSNISNNEVHYRHSFVRMDGFYSSGELVAGTECDNITISNNVVDKTDSASENAIRIRAAKNIHIDGNSFVYYNLSTQGGFVLSIATDVETSNISLTNNKSKFPGWIVNANSFLPSLYTKNNTMLEAISPQYDYTDLSGSGTFAIPLTYLGGIVLQLGASSYSNTVKITPWLLDGDKFSGNNLTWKIPVIKSDGTAGSVTLSVTNEGKDFSWSGDVSIRRMYGTD